jgi:hypothetical protein
MAATHDLRRKAQRLYNLRRRYVAHDKLSDDEMNELRIGITTEEEIEEYAKIIDDIRGERRSASPSKKTKATTAVREEKAVQTKPIDLFKFS